jgi:hypothetical protein
MVVRDTMLVQPLKQTTTTASRFHGFIAVRIVGLRN